MSGGRRPHTRGGGTTEPTGEGSRGGGSKERCQLSRRQATPLSVEGDARPKPRSVRFSLERGRATGCRSERQVWGAGC